jgi:hypothetical protein
MGPQDWTEEEQAAGPQQATPQKDPTTEENDNEETREAAHARSLG